MKKIFALLCIIGIVSAVIYTGNLFHVWGGFTLYPNRTTTSWTFTYWLLTTLFGAVPLTIVFVGQLLPEPKE